MRFSKYIIIEERCKCCEACLQACTDNAVKRMDNGRCRIDQNRCTGCGMCMDVCQVQAVKKKFRISFFFNLAGSRSEVSPSLKCK